MTDLLRIEYVPLSQVRRWDRNPKKHDIGALVTAIERYGFVDPPKFDPTLNNGEGGLVYGNGRDEALEWMKAQKKKLPRGIAVSGDEWCMPIVFGVDAASQTVAEALAIDHNNLTMAGGEYTAVDMLRMWTGDYTDILKGLAKSDELPLTVDGDDLDLLLRLDGTPFDPASLWKGMPEFENEAEAARTLHVHFPTDDNCAKFCELLGLSITDKTKTIWYPSAPEHDKVVFVNDES